MTDKVHPVDEMLVPPKLFTLGQLRVREMYPGAVAVPLIVGRALKPELGVTLAPIGPMVAIANAQLAAGVTGPDAARGIFGAIIAAGIISIIIAPLISKMLRFFPPMVTGTIILVIGISLMRIGINWIFGNPVGRPRRRSSTRSTRHWATSRFRPSCWGRSC